MKRPHHDPDAQAIYRICVEGTLDDDWGGWLGDMVVAAPVARGPDIPITTLTGPIRDQVSLRSMLNRLWDLNLTLVSVTRLSPDTAPGDQEQD